MRFATLATRTAAPPIAIPLKSLNAKIVAAGDAGHTRAIAALISVNSGP